MENKDFLKEEETRLKKMFNTYSSCANFYDAMETLYERISNKEDEYYSAKYDLIKICRNKTLKELSKKMQDTNTIIIEMQEYKDEPCGFLIIYNQFDNKNKPTKWEFYRLRRF